VHRADFRLLTTGLQALGSLFEPQKDLALECIALYQQLEFWHPWLCLGLRHRHMAKEGGNSPDNPRPACEVAGAERREGRGLNSWHMVNRSGNRRDRVTDPRDYLLRQK
jgi:hypothetical protein